MFQMYPHRNPGRQNQDQSRPLGYLPEGTSHTIDDAGDSVRHHSSTLPIPSSSQWYSAGHSSQQIAQVPSASAYSRDTSVHTQNDPRWYTYPSGHAAIVPAQYHNPPPVHQWTQCYPSRNLDTRDHLSHLPAQGASHYNVPSPRTYPVEPLQSPSLAGLAGASPDPRYSSDLNYQNSAGSISEPRVYFDRPNAPRGGMQEPTGQLYDRGIGRKHQEMPNAAYPSAPLDAEVYGENVRSARAPIAPLATPADSSRTTGRYSLHIRQQPRAARAGPDGKDRRPIDPPVVLQLLMRDFDPSSREDVNDLQDSTWVVHCRLCLASSPSTDVSTVEERLVHGGSRIARRQILGEYVSQAIFTPKDPDPATAVMHPSSTESTRFPTSKTNWPLKDFPGTFFIFPDVSVRSPGEYLLTFSLMATPQSTRDTGAQVPATVTISSDPFMVYPAKGFDKIQESTPLVKALAKVPGAPATLKLKKGPGSREEKRERDEDSESSG